ESDGVHGKRSLARAVCRRAGGGPPQRGGAAWRLTPSRWGERKWKWARQAGRCLGLAPVICIDIERHRAAQATDHVDVQDGSLVHHGAPSDIAEGFAVGTAQDVEIGLLPTWPTEGATAHLDGLLARVARGGIIGNLTTRRRGRRRGRAWC